MRAHEIADDCVSLFVARRVSAVHMCDDECDAHLGGLVDCYLAWTDELVKMVVGGGGGGLYDTDPRLDNMVFCSAPVQPNFFLSFFSLNARQV